MRGRVKVTETDVKRVFHLVRTSFLAHPIARALWIHSHIADKFVTLLEEAAIRKVRECQK